MLYLYQSFIFLLGRLHFFLHFFFTFMENLFKKYPILTHRHTHSPVFYRTFYPLGFLSKKPARDPLFHFTKRDFAVQVKCEGLGGPSWSWSIQGISTWRWDLTLLGPANINSAWIYLARTVVFAVLTDFEAQTRITVQMIRRWSIISKSNCTEQSRAEQSKAEQMKSGTSGTPLRLTTNLLSWNYSVSSSDWFLGTKTIYSVKKPLEIHYFNV